MYIESKHLLPLGKVNDKFEVSRSIVEFEWEQITARLEFSVLAVVELAVVDRYLKQFMESIVSNDNTELVFSTEHIKLGFLDYSVIERVREVRLEDGTFFFSQNFVLPIQLF